MSNSFSIPAKLFHRAYNGKVLGIEAFKLLGLQLTALASYSDPTRPHPGRKFSPILGEGIGALSQGLVSEVVLGSAYALSGTVSFRVRAAAYDGSLAVHSVPSSDVVAGYRSGDKEAFTAIKSTSGTSKPDQGKTELSLFVSMLAWAAEMWLSKQPEGEPLLRTWLRWIQLLNSIGELPITGCSATVAAGLARATTDCLVILVRQLADQAYDLIAYGRSTTGLTSVPPPDGVTDVKFLSLRSPVGWRKGVEDAAQMLMDPVELEGFLSDAVFPRSVARSNNAQAVQAAAQAAQAASAQKSAQSAARAERQEAARLRRAAKKAAATPSTPELDGPQFQTYPWLRLAYRAGRVCMPAGGPYSTLLVGPAGTLKTSSIFSIGDGMPTIKLSASSQSEIALFLGDYGRDQTGQWVPRLGVFANAVRFSMLAAFCVALSRGSKIPATVAAYQGHPLTSVLEKLSDDPGHQGARSDLDQQAYPYYPNVWEVFDAAYWESKANEVGPVVRIFFDEIHDAADNLSLETLLKVALEDMRQVMLSVAGAGWPDIVALNCQFVAAGNPDEATRRGSQFGRALRSRFGFTAPVRYPAADLEEALALQSSEDAAPILKRRPAVLKLPSFNYDPLPWQAKPIPAGLAKAAREFAAVTREERQKGTLPDCLDVRGTIQIARTSGYLLSVGQSPEHAFMQGLQPVLPRLVQPDEDGLPMETDVEMLRQKAQHLARKHHL